MQPSPASPHPSPPSDLLPTQRAGERHLDGCGDPSRTPWCSLLHCEELSQAEVDLLDSIAQTRSVPAGHLVLSRGSAAEKLVAVRSGDVALGYRDAEGVFHAERVVHGPAWVDLSSAWTGTRHMADARALGSAALVELPRAALAARMGEQPSLAQRVIEGLAREVQTLAAATHELVHKDAPGRLALWLLRHCERVADPAGTTDARVQAVVHLNERKRDIASQLAITPETLSRLMRAMTQRGVIEVAGYLVRVFDVDELERMAQ